MRPMTSSATLARSNIGVNGMTIESITLLGSASGRNAGDAALMSGIMDTVDPACGERLLYEIPTINTEFAWRTYKNNRVRPVGLMPWNLTAKMMGLPTLLSLRRTDLSLIFDAVLFDRALYNPMFNFLSSFRLLLPYAKRQGKKMGMFNCGLGPVTTQRGREMLRDVCEMMDFITVRDSEYLDLLEDLGVQNKNILLTADAALNVTAAPPSRVDLLMHELGFSEEEEILGINVNTYLDSWSDKKGGPLSRESFVATIASAVDRAAEQIGCALLFVVSAHHDISITKEVMSRIKYRGKVRYFSNEQHSHFELKGILGRLNLLFAMRLHAMILASSEHTPITSLAYQYKNEHYFNSLGLSKWNSSFDQFSEETITKQLIGAWEARKETRQILNSRIPELKWRANHAALIVAGLHRGDNIGKLIERLKTEPYQGAALGGDFTRREASIG